MGLKVGSADDHSQVTTVVVTQGNEALYEIKYLNTKHSERKLVWS